MATVLYAVDVWRHDDSIEENDLMAFRSKKAAMRYARDVFRHWREDGWNVQVWVKRYTLFNLPRKDLYCFLLSRTLFASQSEVIATLNAII